MRRSLFATLLLFPLAGCTSLLGSDEQELALEESNGIALSLAAQGTSLAAGDTLRLTARVANTGSTPVRLSFSSGCQVLPYVENAAGKIVYPGGGGWMCTAALTELELTAGEAEEYHFRTPLPAGEYRAYARLDATRGEQRLSLRTREVRVVVK
jgi:hypothetical protein